MPCVLVFLTSAHPRILARLDLQDPHRFLSLLSLTNYHCEAHRTWSKNIVFAEKQSKTSQCRRERGCPWPLVGRLRYSLVPLRSPGPIHLSAACLVIQLTAMTFALQYRACPCPLISARCHQESRRQKCLFKDYSHPALKGPTGEHKSLRNLRVQCKVYNLCRGRQH